MSSRHAFLFRLVLSLVALLLVARMVSGAELLAELRRANPGLLALALLMSLADRVLMAWKWRMLLQGLGVERTLREATRIYFVGTFYGSFLPTGVGGDVIRVLEVGGGRETVGKTTASVVMERALGLIASALLVVGCLALLVEHERPHLGRFVLIAAIALGLAVAGLAFLLHGRVPARLERLVAVFRRYATQPALLWRFFALSFIEQLFPVVVSYLIGRALGFPISFGTFLVIIPVTLFFARIPISIDGLGVVEGLYVLLFAQAGLGATESFLLALVGRAVTVCAVLPGVFLRRSQRPAAGDPESADDPDYRPVPVAGPSERSSRTGAKV